MTGNEDCASVLEQFMHDVANLPAEISHMMEEIQAKDKEMHQHLSSINSKDGSIQKHIKLNGSMVPHPKEKEWSETILKGYDACYELQEQKIGLSDKACLLLERQLKRLDVKIRELQNDGQLQDGGTLPSVFNRKAQHPDPQRQFPDLPLPSNLPLQIASANAMNVNMNAHRMNIQHHTGAHLAQPVPRQVAQMAAAGHPTARSSAPATPAAVLLRGNQGQRERDHSAGADQKRRKINPSTSFNANIPTQPSSLRQSSLGPGTPKAGTPTGTSRAGSLPRSIAAPAHAAATKKSGLSKKVAPHQQVSKLKGKPGPKQGRLPFGKKKGGRVDSPHRSRGTTADSGDADSVLSSAEPSDTESHTTRSRRGVSAIKKAHQQKEEPTSDVDMGEGEEEEDQEDDKRYCFCNERSYGEMVACENESCPYEWFHLQCLGLKKIDEEVWYCPTCREQEDVKKLMKEQGLSASKMPGQRKVWPALETQVHVK